MHVRHLRPHELPQSTPRHCERVRGEERQTGRQGMEIAFSTAQYEGHFDAHPARGRPPPEAPADESNEVEVEVEYVSASEEMKSRVL